MLKGYHTGVDIQTTQVYSVCEGVVIEIGNNIEGITVSVQYNVNICVRYCCLQNTELTLGQGIHMGDLVGTTEDFVRFEYAITDKLESLWPVRINILQYYKQDPINIVEGTTILQNGGRSSVTLVMGETFQNVPLTGTMVTEFSGGRYNV